MILKIIIIILLLKLFLIIFQKVFSEHQFLDDLLDIFLLKITQNNAPVDMIQVLST